jgi:hypothetical protein
MAENRIEYRFVLTGQTPETISQGRLAQYLSDLAALYGEEAAVHFVRLEESSLAIVSAVEIDADPDVSERVQTADLSNAPPDVRSAYQSLQRQIAHDGGPAYIARGSSRILKFPTGAALVEPQRAYGPFWQSGHLDGRVILIGGKSDPVSVRLQNTDGDVLICKARRPIAKRLREYLYEGPLRVQGQGKWFRDASGDWRMETFNIDDFSELDDEPLSAAIARLREIDAPWKDRPDPLADLDTLRHE